MRQQPSGRHVDQRAAALGHQPRRHARNAQFAAGDNAVIQIARALDNTFDASARLGRGAHAADAHYGHGRPVEQGAVAREKQRRRRGVAQTGAEVGRVIVVKTGDNAHALLQKSFQRVGKLYAAMQKRIEAIGLFLGDVQKHHQAANIRAQKPAQPSGSAVFGAAKHAVEFRGGQRPRVFGAVCGKGHRQKHGGKSVVSVMHSKAPSHNRPRHARLSYYTTDRFALQPLAEGQSMYIYARLSPKRPPPSLPF